MDELDKTKQERNSWERTRGSPNSIKLQCKTNAKQKFEIENRHSKLKGDNILLRDELDNTKQVKQLSKHKTLGILMRTEKDTEEIITQTLTIMSSFEK